MYGINYQKSGYMLVVLIGSMFKNRIDNYLVGAGYIYNKRRLV